MKWGDSYYLTHMYFVHVFFFFLLVSAVPGPIRVKLLFLLLLLDLPWFCILLVVCPLIKFLSIILFIYKLWIKFLFWRTIITLKRFDKISLCRRLSKWRHSISIFSSSPSQSCGEVLHIISKVWFPSNSTSVLHKTFSSPTCLLMFCNH